jgi:hypothetical protein
VKKFIYLYIVPFYLLISCSPNKEISDDLENKIEEKKEIQYPNEILDSLNLFPKKNLEFNLFESFFTDSLKNHTNHKLSSNFVKLLSGKLFSDDATERNSYYLNDYYLIQQAKKDKKYEEYVQKLDIGMMQDANCYALSRIEFGDSLAILIWKIDFSSYEACPYYIGTHILGTLIADGKCLETLQLANMESAADAPMSSNSTQFVKISKTGKIQCNYETIVDEEETTIEHSKEKKEFQITKSGFKLISTKK